MKNFRKPKVSILFAFLIFGYSCSNTSENTESIKNENLTLVIEKHISLTKEVLEIISKEQDVDFEKLSKIPDYFKTKKELKEYLKNSNFKNYEKLSILFDKVSNNLNGYLLSIKNINNYTEDDLKTIITNEIKKQTSLDNKKNIDFSRKIDCKGAFKKSQENCGDNYAISVGVVVVSGFVSFGWGTVIGYVAANGIYLKCLKDAESAYNNCL